MPDFPPGEVWLAGAGPGDPRLLTVLALHAVSAADDIVHDALVDPRVLKLARPEAELISAGKRGGRPSPKQRDINEVLIERARLGRRVLRLKGGDPFVFGRGWDEASALTKAGHPLSHHSRHYLGPGRRGACRHSRHDARHQPCGGAGGRPSRRRWTVDRRLGGAGQARPADRALYADVAARRGCGGAPEGRPGRRHAGRDPAVGDDGGRAGASRARCRNWWPMRGRKASARRPSS